jgi:hypothetical protein
VDFKYERLSNFCFACGKIGHQMKECEEVDDVDENNYNDIEEKSQAFGPWLRASPLPRIFEETRKEASSGSCSKNLFPSSSQSKGGTSVGKKDKEQEVDQQPAEAIEKQLVTTKETVTVGVEDVAESLGAVAISTNFVIGANTKAQVGSKGRKWVRQKSTKPARAKTTSKLMKELGKRQLVDVAISEGNIDFIQNGDKKLKGDVVMEECSKPDDNVGKVVLEDQHRQDQ